MAKLNWDGNDFRNSQDSSGTVADNISRNGNLQQGYKHGSLTEGLVAYYPMEKGEGEVLHDGALDNLGQIKPGSNGDNTKTSDMWTTGKTGNHALTFDGNDDYVDCGADSIFSFSKSDFSIAAWFKTTANGGRIVVKNNNTNSLTGYVLQLGQIVSDGKVTGGYRDGNGNSQFVGSENTYNDGNWHIAVLTRDSSKSGAESLTLYIDGDEERSEVTDQGSNKTGDDGAPLTIGGQDSISWCLNGEIDDVRIYDRVLSEPEIKALHNEGKGVQSGVLKKEKSVPGQNEGGISRYKFDEGVDDSWGSNNGEDNTNTDVGYESGVYGQSKKFDGGEGVSADVISKLSSNDSYSVSVWFNTDTGGGSGGDNIIDNRIDGSNNFAITIANGVITAGEDQGSPSGYAGAKLPSTGEWHHFVYTRDVENDKYHAFINGSLANTTDTVRTTSGSTGLWIGRRSDGNHKYKGKIDDVRIYNQALTPLQVEKLYHKGAYRISRESTLQ